MSEPASVLVSFELSWACERKLRALLRLLAEMAPEPQKRAHFEALLGLLSNLPRQPGRRLQAIAAVAEAMVDHN